MGVYILPYTVYIPIPTTYSVSSFSSALGAYVSKGQGVQGWGRRDWDSRG